MSYEKQLDLSAVAHEDCAGNLVDLTQPQQLALCTDVPQFVDCDGNPVTPTSAGGEQLYSIFSKLDGGGGPHPDFPTSVLMGNITAGTLTGWSVYEMCATALPADDSNGHSWELGPYASNSQAAGNTITPTGNASPTCATGGTGRPTYTLPDCNVANDICLIPVAPINVANPLYAFQDDGTGNCQRVEIPAVPPVANASCARIATSVQGERNGTVGWYGTAEQRRGTIALAADGTLDPAAQHHVALVDTTAGDVVVTLATPATCDPSIYHVKKVSTDANNITITPASGQIDNAATHTFSGVIGTAGENRMLFWDGTNWWIL